MKISLNGTTHEGQDVRISANVHWEDSEPTEESIWFQMSNHHYRLAVNNADAFLIAAAIPGLYRGERRITIDADVSPEMAERTRIVLTWMKAWFGTPNPIPKLEVTPRKTPLVDAPPRRAGSFLSGGVDSLAVVRSNRLQFDSNHPWYIKYCVLAYGFDINDEVSMSHAIQHGRAVAKNLHAEHIPVRTNVRHLVRDSTWMFWMQQYFAAAMASIAHLFVRSFDTAFLGSSYDIPNVVPWGSNPALDWTYGSSLLQFVHDGHHLSRLEKTVLIAPWQTAIDHVRVCGPVVEGQINCGKCEKCTRTMLALQSVGRLNQAGAFAVDLVTPEQIDNLNLSHAYMLDYYRELIPPMHERGETELVAAMERLMARYLAEQKRLERNRKVKAIDMKLTGGRFWKLTAGAKHVIADRRTTLQPAAQPSRSESSHDETMHTAH